MDDGIDGDFGRFTLPKGQVQLQGYRCHGKYCQDVSISHIHQLELKDFSKRTKSSLFLVFSKFFDLLLVFQIRVMK